MYAKKPTIALIYPWKQFSVGTRFLHTPKLDTESSYAIMHIDFTTNKLVADFIPHHYALVEKRHDKKTARTLFVKLINDLVDQVALQHPSEVIAYVWGGSSFVTTYPQNNFFLKDAVWHRDGKTDPYTGYDCSEFVMRMAQLAGIHFPWKTTSIMETSCKKLQKHDHLENGDLLWVPGHIMIASNIENNELIQSRSYKNGFGCVYRSKLHECFKDITTYDDLLAAYQSNQEIALKNVYGIPLEKTHPIKILKLVH